MKPLIQKLPLNEAASFVCRTYRTPYFETPWHRHTEVELLLITEGHGTALIGSYFGEYRVGDVFLLGPNLPHWFRKAHDEAVGSALVIHFDTLFLGEQFLGLPESRPVQAILQQAGKGLQLPASICEPLRDKLTKMEEMTGFGCLMQLLDCLNDLATSPNWQILINGEAVFTASKSSQIGLVFEHTFRHFQRPIPVHEVADLVRMSLPSFGRFFRQSTKKSYTEFLKEVRVNHACKRLVETEEPVSRIGFESGYNSLANFNRQFKEIKNMSPTSYRERFEKQLAGPRRLS